MFSKYLFIYLKACVLYRNISFEYKKKAVLKTLQAITQIKFVKTYNNRYRPFVYQFCRYSLSNIGQYRRHGIVKISDIKLNLAALYLKDNYNLRSLSLILQRVPAKCLEKAEIFGSRCWKKLNVRLFCF